MAVFTLMYAYLWNHLYANTILLPLFRGNVAMVWIYPLMLLVFGKLFGVFHVAVARRVDGLKQLLEARTQLANLQTYMDGKSGAENLISRLLQDPSLLRTLSAAPKSQETQPTEAPSDPSGSPEQSA